MKLMTLHLPEKWVQKVDTLVEKGIYPNRSEALRYFLREGMKVEGIWDKMLETTVVELYGHCKERVTRKKVEEKRCEG